MAKRRRSFKHTRQALTKIGENVIEEGRKELKKKDAIASKKLYNSLEAKIIGTAPNFKLKIEGEDYGEVLDKGISGSDRKEPGSPFRAGRVIKGRTTTTKASASINVSTESIKDWIKAKGIPVSNINSAAFLIARKISRYGYSARNWIKTATKSEQKETIKILEVAMAKDLVRNIKALTQRK